MITFPNHVNEFLLPCSCHMWERWDMGVQTINSSAVYGTETLYDQSSVVMPCNLWEPCSPVLSVLKFCGSCSSQILSGCLSVSVNKENTVVLCFLRKMRLSYGRPRYEFEDLILVFGMVLCWRLFTKMHLPRLSLFQVRLLLGNDGRKGWWRMVISQQDISAIFHS